ncbi:MAG: ShET2/EspL2 family type III secretion system effector toxin [Neisseriaceae bacterium]
MNVGCTKKPTFASFDEYSKNKNEKLGNTNGKSRILFHNDEGKLIYQSKNGVETIQNNMKAEDKHGEPIVCRQLGFEKLRQGKNYHTSFESSDNISKIEALWNNDYDYQGIVLRADSYLGFHIDYFGLVLSETCNNMKPKDSKKLTLLSENHLMSIEIKYKINPKRYIIKFYDPNYTNIHKRAVCKNIEGISKLSIHDFMGDYELEKYFPKYKSGMFAIYNDVNNFSQEQTNKEIFFHSSVSNEELMWYSMYYRFPNVGKLVNKAIQDRCFDLLSTSNKGGCNLLKLALDDNCSDNAKLFIDSILKSDFTSDQKVELLSVKYGIFDKPSFYSLLEENKNIKGLKIFITEILNSDLPGDMKVKLLCPWFEGKPGLYLALECGHVNVIKIYIEAVLNSDLTDDQKMEILLAKNAMGESGLYAAYMNNCTDAVKVFTETILKSNLPLKLKMELFLAKGCEFLSCGTGLNAALEKGYVETIKVFIEIVENSDLPESVKCELFLARNDEGKTAFHRYNSNGIVSVGHDISDENSRQYKAANKLASALFRLI